MQGLQFQDDSCKARVRELLAGAEGGADSWKAWSCLAGEYGQSVFREVLFHLTHMEFEAQEAGEHWRNILLNQDRLTRSLGREVRLATAMCDYFLHQHPVFDDPVLVEARILALNEEFAFHDELTGLHNRRAFNRELSRELERSRRSRQPFSLLMVDVDYFKAFNDNFGHLAGDAVLRQLAAVLSRTARIVDQVSRYGGEEFAVILPGTDKDMAPQVAERHRQAVVKHHFRDGVTSFGPLSVSLGAATYPDHAKNEEELIAMADRALYEAKESGRNCIRASGDDLRHFPRVPLELPGECRVRNDRLLRFKGHTVNISRSGMLYESKRPIEVGSKVEAVLTNPNTGSLLPLHARSVRLLDENRPKGGSYYIGMRFEQESETMDILEQLLEGRDRIGHA
jgi:diguanylate cyclase (GGDEF)-like protein